MGVPWTNSETYRDKPIWTNLLGLERVRHYLLYAHLLTAQQAMNFGEGSEVLQTDKLTQRGMGMAAKPLLTLRYSRWVITHRLKRLLAEGLNVVLAVESLAAIDHKRPSVTMKDHG